MGEGVGVRVAVGPGVSVGPGVGVTEGPVIIKVRSLLHNALLSEDVYLPTLKIYAPGPL